MRNPFSTASSVDRLIEDEMYARIYEEIESGRLDKAAQARAIEESGDDDGAIRKAYIKHRFARIKAELTVTNELAAQVKKQEHKRWKNEEKRRVEDDLRFKQEREVSKGDKSKDPAWVTA